MFQTITQRQFCISFPPWPIHWLKEEMLEIELLVKFRRRAFLRKHKFQFIPSMKFEFCPCFRTHTYPIEVGTSQLSPICFNGDFKTLLMESTHQIFVQLE